MKEFFRSVSKCMNRYTSLQYQWYIPDKKIITNDKINISRIVVCFDPGI